MIKTNKFLQPEGAPVTTIETRSSGVAFDNNYEIQTRSIRVSNFVNNSGTATALGTFADGSSLGIAARLTSPFGRANFGVPYIAIYIGTAVVGSNQIYPNQGNNPLNVNNAWNIWSGFDWQAWNGTSSVYTVHIENNSGTAGTVFVVADYKELRFTQKRGDIS